MSDERIKLTFPKGTLKYPRLQEPDDKFKAEGEYSTKLVLTPEQAKPLIDKLEQCFKEHLAETKAANPKKKVKAVTNRPWKADTTKEKDESGEYVEVETGNIAFTFRRPAKIVKKDKPPLTLRVALFDAAGAKLVTDKRIGGGTIARVAAEVRGYFTEKDGAGIRLDLEAVQVLKLVEGGRQSATDYGFAAEEEIEGEDMPSGDDGDGDSDEAAAGDAADY